MKTKRFIVSGIIILLIFASFTSLFYLSAVFDSEKEVKNFIRSLGFNPFFTIYLSTPTTRLSKTNSTRISLDPFQQLLIAGGEISPQSILLNINKSHNQKSLSSTFNEIRKLPVNFLTENDVKKIEEIKGVKQVFIFNPTDSLFNEKVRYKESPLIPVFAVPPGFIKNIGLKLKYGKYFSDKGNNKHEIILTYEISKLLFGNKNPVGTVLKGYRGDYKVIGVLDELNDYQYFSMYGIASGGYIALPGDYVPYNANSASFGYDKFRQIENRIIVLPELGAEKSVKKKISELLRNKGYKNIIYPVIHSTYDDAKRILGVSLRMQKFLVIAVTGLAISLLSWFIVWAFVELEILTRIKEIFVRRSIGATKKAIFYTYFKDFIIYGAVSLFVAICIFFLLEPKLSELNVGNTGTNVPIGSGEIIHKIGLSYGSVLITFGVLIVILFFSISRETIFGLSKSLINWFNTKLFGLKKSKKQFFVLVAIMLSFSSFLSVFVVTRNLKVSMQNIYGECVPSVIRISSTGNIRNKLILLPLGVINYPDYSYSDYKALENFLGDKAVVGFRSILPFYSVLKFKNKNLKVRMSDCTPSFFEVYNLRMERGRFVSESDILKKNYVCVIGSNVRTLLRCNLGEKLFQYKVVGILSPENKLIDNTVFVPLGILNQNVRNVSGSGTNKTKMFYIKVANPNLRNEIGKKALAFLNKRHPGKIPGLLIDLTKTLNQITLVYMPLYLILSIFTFLALLSSFLSLSALLFIEVIRKTREIGIKKAIGATSKEITKEFTLKGLKTTIIALLVGIPIGILISLIIEKLKGWSYYIPVNILILVIFISLLLGFIFSFLPAYFASKINPASAVKSE